MKVRLQRFNVDSCDVSQCTSDIHINDNSLHGEQRCSVELSATSVYAINMSD